MYRILNYIYLIRFNDVYVMSPREDISILHVSNNFVASTNQTNLAWSKVLKSFVSKGSLIFGELFGTQ